MAPGTILATAAMLAIPALAGLIPYHPRVDVSLTPRLASPPAPATTLLPIRSLPRKSNPLGRRSLVPAITPQNSSTLAWLGPDGTVAEFTMLSSATDAEAIVNLELLDPEDKFIKTIECPPAAAGQGPGQLKIQFADAADLDDAADVWNWVNQNEGNRFLVVVGEGECQGGNAERRLFRVGGVTYQNAAETAVLQVDEQGWQAVGTFDLTLGKVSPTELGRRGLFDDIKGAVGGVVDNVVDGAKNAVEEVKNVPDKVADGAKKVVEEVKKAPAKVVDAAQGAVDKVKEVPKKVVDEVKKVPAKVTDAAKDAVNKVTEEVKKVPGKVAGAAKDAVDKVAEEAKKIPEKVADAAKGAVDKVAEEAKKVPEKVADAAKDVVDKVKEVPGKIADVAEDIPKQIAEAVKDLPLDDLAKAIPLDAVAALDDVLNPGFNADFSIPFDNRFGDTPLSVTVDNVTVSAQCKECLTTGSFDVKGRFRSVNLVMEEAWIELSTKGVSAKAVIALGLKGALTEKLAERTVNVFKASPAGIVIPGVLTIGPTVSVDMGVEVSEVTAGLNLVLGGTATIPASSSRLDFLSEAGSRTTGWTPSFRAEPFKADGFVEVKASAFIQPGIGLEISVVETGLEAEISAKTPSLSASLKAITTSDCSACGAFQNGLQGGLTLGASIGASLKKKVLSTEDVLFGVTFAEAQFPLADFCQGIGPEGNACRAKL